MFFKKANGKTFSNYTLSRSVFRPGAPGAAPASEATPPRPFNPPASKCSNRLLASDIVLAFLAVKIDEGKFVLIFVPNSSKLRGERRLS